MTSSVAVPSSPVQVSPTLLWLSLHTGSGGHQDGENKDPEPSHHLKGVMNMHRPDCASVIQGMVGKMADKLMQPGDHMRIQALRLYYSILENMIHSETARLTRLHLQSQAQSNPPPSSTTSTTPQTTPAAATTTSTTAAATPPPTFRFDAWMFSKAFHASLIAVSFELVLFAHHSPPSKLFPYVIDTLDLSAWDFVKHLELVVRALPSALPQHHQQTNQSANGITVTMQSIATQGDAYMNVPSPTKRYLKRLENECLAHLVWRKNSPLLKILREQELREMREKEAADNLPTSSVDSEKSAPSEEEKKSLDSSATSTHSAPSPTPPSVGMGNLSVTHSRQFDLFSRQLFTLAADHLSWLCSPSALSISNLHMEACFELLLEILTCRTHLLYERHLDTIILCVIYNITCKICVPTTVSTPLPGQPTPPPLDFKRIISVYLSRREQNATKVVKEISSYAAGPTAPDVDEKMNIIAFYNKYFIHEIKIYSLEHIKPKLIQALDEQALIRSTNATSQPTSPNPTLSPTSTLTPASFPIHTRSTASGPVTPNASNTITTPNFAPSNPSPSPRTRSSLPHRIHPYSVTPYSHLPVPAGAVTPGYGPHQGPQSSIHAFLSPRKLLNIPPTNIYLSRLAAPPPPSNLAGVANRVANVTGSIPSSSTTSSSSVSSSARSSKLLTPSKSHIRSPARVQPTREEDALVALTSFPHSPAHPTATSIHPSKREAHTPSGVAPPTGRDPLTPMSRSLYHFGESPRKSLDEINRMLNGPTHQHIPPSQSQPQPTPSPSHLSASALAGVGSSITASSYASPQPRAQTGYPGSAQSQPGSGRNNRGSARQLFTQS